MSLIAHGGVNLPHDGISLPLADISPSTAMLLFTLGIAVWFAFLAAHVAGMTGKSRPLKVCQSLAVSLVSWLVGVAMSGGIFFLESPHLPKASLTALVLAIPLALMGVCGMWFLVRIKKSPPCHLNPEGSSIAPPRKTFMTRKAWVVGLLALLVAGLYFFFVPNREQGDLMRRSHQIRDVLLACQVYAIQHGGQMPQKLEEVVEAYGQAKGTAPNRYLARAIIELDFRTPGLNTKEGDSRTVVLQEKRADVKGRRMLGFLGGNIGMQDHDDQNIPLPSQCGDIPHHGAATAHANYPMLAGDRFKDISAEDLHEIKQLAKQVFQVFQPILISACTSEMHKEDTVAVHVYNLCSLERNRMRRMSHLAFYRNTGSRPRYKPEEMVMGPHWLAFKKECHEVVQVAPKQQGSMWKTIAVWDGELSPIHVIGSISDENVMSAVDYLRNNPANGPIISITEAGKGAVCITIKTGNHGGSMITLEFNNGKWNAVSVRPWVS